MRASTGQAVDAERERNDCVVCRKPEGQGAAGHGGDAAGGGDPGLDQEGTAAEGQRHGKGGKEEVCTQDFGI